MKQADFKPVGVRRAKVGESPVWDDRRQLFWSVDIEGRTLHATRLDGAETAAIACPGRPTAVGLDGDGGLVVAVEIQVWRCDPETSAWCVFAEVEAVGEGRRLNDGKVGPDGCFWIGSMVEGGEPASAALFRVAPDGGVTRLVRELQASNGLAWTADGRRMMHSDSRGPWIDAWTFDPVTGDLSQRRRIVQLSEADGRPDGAAMDMDGVYWSCGVSAGCLNRFDAAGARLASVALPVAAPTMCAFGGDDGTALLVTSHSLAADPHDTMAGALLLGRTDVAGVPAFRFGVSPR